MERAPHAGPRARRYDAAQREYERARVELGERGVTVGDLFAYAYDDRAQRYNVVRLYARADDRVTRWLVNERPHGYRRARSMLHMPTRTRSEGTSPVRVFDAWNGTRRTHAMDVALRRSDARMVAERERRAALQRVDAANAAGYVAHTCPRAPRDSVERTGERLDGMPTVVADCTRTHATERAQRACKGTHTPRMDADTFSAYMAARLAAYDARAVA
jgi:hypothetical protein